MKPPHCPPPVGYRKRLRVPSGGGVLLSLQERLEEEERGLIKDRKRHRFRPSPTLVINVSLSLSFRAPCNKCLAPPPTSTQPFLSSTPRRRGRRRRSSSKRRVIKDLKRKANSLIESRGTRQASAEGLEGASGPDLSPGSKRREGGLMREEERRRRRAFNQRSRKASRLAVAWL
jgi:hypothetical protein